MKALLLFIVGLALSSLAFAQSVSLRAQRPLIEQQYPEMRWIDTRTLSKMMSGPEKARPILLDAREKAEYSVSHLQGARRVDPKLKNMASLSLPRDSTIVVYCSVGQRSAAFVKRLVMSGYVKTYNLEGGIFQWANEGRPLFKGTRSASVVHPYDKHWGEMLLPRYRSRTPELR